MNTKKIPLKLVLYFTIHTNKISVFAKLHNSSVLNFFFFSIQKNQLLIYQLVFLFYLFYLNKL